MSDIVEKLLSLSPEQIQQFKEDHENFDPAELMTPEELEKQAAIFRKASGINRDVIHEMKRATSLLESYGIKPSRKSPETATELPTVIYPDAVSAANSKALVELIGQMLDIQEKILEGAEQNRRLSEQRYMESLKIANQERKITEQRYAKSQKLERRERIKNTLILILTALGVLIAGIGLTLTISQ